MARVGQLLIVDLGSGEIERTGLPGSLLRQFLGGRGINAWMLARYVGPTTDPLGPENTLVLSCGLLTGTNAVLAT